MKTRVSALAFAALALPTVQAFAQHHHGGHGEHATQSHAAHAPYAGMQAREIKALSEQQIADLRAGKGMQLALPAELNGYPGPAHVLELADALKLTAEQKATTQTLFNEMQDEAKALGAELVSAERELDVLFRERTATPQSLSDATSKAAAAQGRLRAAHLRYHLAMVEVLTTEQVETYNRLRGY